MSHWMEEARQIAAQCWCDEETQDRVMDPALAEAVARRIAVWMDTAARHALNEDFYRALLDKVVDNLHPSVKDSAFTCDDGSRASSPLWLLVPRCVEEMTRKLRSLE